MPILSKKLESSIEKTFWIGKQLYIFKESTTYHMREPFRRQLTADIIILSHRARVYVEFYPKNLFSSRRPCFLLSDSKEVLWVTLFSSRDPFFPFYIEVYFHF